MIAWESKHNCKNWVTFVDKLVKPKISLPSVEGMAAALLWAHGMPCELEELMWAGSVGYQPQPAPSWGPSGLSWLSALLAVPPGSTGLPFPRCSVFPGCCMFDSCLQSSTSGCRQAGIDWFIIFPLCPVAHINGRVVRALGRLSSLFRNLKLLLCARSLKVFQWERGKEEKDVCCSLVPPCVLIPPQAPAEPDERWWLGQEGAAMAEAQAGCSVPHPHSQVTARPCWFPVCASPAEPVGCELGPWGSRPCQGCPLSPGAARGCGSADPLLSCLAQ